MNKYKEMFDKINISDECLRKVEHMEKNNHKIKKFRIRYVAVAAVMLAIFAMTDVVSYAATGYGITKHVHVFLENNSDKKELKENGKGKYIYEGEDKKYELEMNEDEMIEQYKTFLQSPYFIIVNKNHPIPEGYQIDLSPLKNTNITMEKEAASQFNAFLQAVEDAGISYRILDGFRAADMQQTLYDDEYKKNLAAGYSGDSTIAAKTALNVAPVGFSEHQTGLAVDITQTGQKVTSEVLNSDFYKFAKENLYKYGFIIRYPENKKDSTGYDNKPWHFRYIGNVEQAKYITDKNISLEEYIEYLKKKISDYEKKN